MPITFGEFSENIMKDILSQLDESPYALFGHSMGAAIAYDFAKRCHEEGRRGPAFLALSGRSSPGRWGNRHKNKLSDLNEADFIERIKQLGGTPDIVFERQDLYEAIIPILKADLRLVESYCPNELPALPYPFHIMFGAQDTEVLDGIRDWTRFSHIECTYTSFPGGHFYLKNFPDQVIRKLEEWFVSHALVAED